MIGLPDMYTSYKALSNKDFESFSVVTSAAKPPLGDLTNYYNDFLNHSSTKKEHNTNTQSEIPKNMINLENVILLETKLWMIKENIPKMDGISELCEDWWEISHNETMLQNLGHVFKEPRYKAILKTAIAAEISVISIIFSVSMHLETPPKSILISR
jgi:hypothetical protein